MRWDIGSDKLVLAYVGRLNQTKGPDLLIEALDYLPRRLRNKTDVLIAGDGPLEKQLQGRVGELGWEPNVHFLGFTHRPEEVFQAADIVAVPSRMECFGLSLVEAMACGSAVVAANIGGLAANLSHPDARGAGLLVRPEDPRALAGGIAELADEPDRRRQMGRKARQFVCKHFSSLAVLQLLEDLVENRNTQRVSQARWTPAIPRVRLVDTPPVSTWPEETHAPPRPNTRTTLQGL